MKSLIQLTKIYKSYGSRELFEGISLSIMEGECFALIGENGSGKTTLLNLLAGNVFPDSGNISKTEGLNVALLPQEIVLPNTQMTVREYLSEGRLTELEKEMKELQNALNEKEALEKWQTLHEEYEHLGGYKKPPLEEVLHGLKIEADLDNTMSSLSSGKRIRIALAKLLLANPDLALLDEPTNHLDQEMIEWLKNEIKKRKKSTVIVSHDREFLNATCNTLIELKNGALKCFGGNYDFYLTEKERIIEQEIKEYEAQVEEKTFLKQKIKALTFAKKKATPLKDRNIMAYDKRGEKHEQSTARTLNELKARLAEIEKNPLTHPRPKNITGLRFSPLPLLSEIAIEFRDVKIAFGKKVLFEHFTKTLRKGARVIIEGPNGCGKTTLLRAILQKVPLSEGTIRIAPSAKIAYLDQEVEELPLDMTPLHFFQENYQLSEEILRKELHKAALGGEELLKSTFRNLSVGQRKRMMLLTLVLEKPNLLLLDEPTNHLDLLTLEAFEKALLNFEGSILAVSHDQTFIRKIGNEIWEI